ncbi:hypothetical protein NS14008_24660 [Nocardia seriolae]|nr:hypothetical protein NS14008_24660 [Nocardia seriolae]
MKIVTAVRRRTDELRRVFEEQKSDLHLCAGLMCDEPEAATAMLEAAFARAIAAWRGPPNPALRVYVLCSFVHLLTARDTWVRRGAGQNAAGTPLATLPLPTRIAVVLREFANLPVADIAVIVGRTADDVTRDLARAAAELERRRSERRWWSR